MRFAFALFGDEPDEDVGDNENGGGPDDQGTRADGKVVHRNCDNIFDGIYTDAEMLLCKQGMPYAVVNASRSSTDRNLACPSVSVLTV